MNIRRIRRLPASETANPCDYCDEPTEQGFSFYGDNVSGPRGGKLVVCDKCLQRTKQSRIGYWFDPTPEPPTEQPK